MSRSQNKPWSFIKPTVCKPSEKLFALEGKEYTGSRLNKAKLIRPVTDQDIKHTKALSAMGKEIPESWSWRKLGETDPKYKGKIELPRDQGGCGSCWAFSMAMALGDRYSIKYGIDSPYLSPTWLMSSTYKLMEVKPQDSCSEGGDPYMASKWLENNGAKYETCWPYSMIKGKNWISPNQLPNDCCINCCDPKKDKKTTTVYSVLPKSTKTLIVITNKKIDANATIAAIQREIMTSGPVVCGFQVFDDFMPYWVKSAPKGGIYVCNGLGESGGHAVTITGWGREKGINYWELRNSWGKSGDNGYCKVAFSTSDKKNKILQLDVPHNYQKDNKGNELYIGGMFAFQPGTLPNVTTIKPSITKKPMKENFKYKVQASSKILGVTISNTLLIILIILIILSIIALIFFISKKHKSLSKNKI